MKITDRSLLRTLHRFFSTSTYSKHCIGLVSHTVWLRVLAETKIYELQLAHASTLQLLLQILLVLSFTCVFAFLRANRFAAGCAAAVEGRLSGSQSPSSL